MAKSGKFCAAVFSLAMLLSAQAGYAIDHNFNERDYILGNPDASVRYPQEAFDLAGQLKSQRKFSDAEGILLDHLNQARKAAPGTDKLGQYMVRLNNVLFDGGKDDLAIKYGEIASKILNKNFYRSKDSIGWLVNIESYLAMGYNRKHQYKEAVQKYTDAIKLAETAPSGKVSSSWIETLKTQKKEAEKNAANWH